MLIERDLGGDFPYNLHDSKVTDVILDEGGLTLICDQIFCYKDGKESIFSGRVVFHQVDADDIYFRVFSEQATGEFFGKKLTLADYKREFGHLPLEIMTETYNWREAVFQGMIYPEDEVLQVMVSIYFWGSLSYNLDKVLSS